MSKVKAKLLARAVEILDGPMTLDKALLIAVIAHAGQEDKGQNSYIRHPLRVMEGLDCEDEMIVGVLHDCPEDRPDLVPLEALPELGCTQNQQKALDALTRREGETYEEFIERIMKSYVAVKVKKKDLRDNSQLWRLKNITLGEKDVARMQNYIHALARLGALRERS